MPALTDPEPLPTVPVTNPKFALLLVQQLPFGFPNCGVLVVFTVSNRSCSLTRSVKCSGKVAMVRVLYGWGR